MKLQFNGLNKSRNEEMFCISYNNSSIGGYKISYLLYKMNLSQALLLLENKL